LKHPKISDIFLNGLLPLIIGAFIYFLKDKWAMPVFVKNYLADGLWSYALLNMLLIIWERTPNSFWMILVFSLPVLFEYGQWTDFIKGTGDMYDIATCFTFFVIALILNPFFKQIFNSHRYDQTD
jgi:hypothetical protein